VPPQHGTNSVRTLVLSQMMAAMVGLAAFLVCGPGYLAAGGALVMTITLMILFDVMHPPAVATSMSFAFRAGDESNLLLFAMAVGIIAVLVVLQRAALWLLARSNNGSCGG
jgi:CBS-domain-containing membrane protein